MNPLYKAILWLDSYVEKPAMYGMYHLIWIFGLIASCVFLTLISKKRKSDSFFRNTLLVCWIMLVLFEFAKELAMGFSVDDMGVGHFSYNFIYFPYQLCSLPFYVLPFIVFLKNEKIKLYFVVPTISFIMLGGTLLVLIPGGFNNSLYLNFHTMMHHSLQVFSSYVCMLWYKKEITLRNYLKCIPLLVGGMSLSIALNTIIYKMTGVHVQLWNLSPVVVFDLDFLEVIRQKIGYVPYVALYFICIFLLSFIVYILPKAFHKKENH